MKKAIKNDRNTRVPCICEARTAKIIHHPTGTCIGTISEEKNDAGEFDWVVRPFYDKIEECKTTIPGFDLDLRLNEYIRTYVPSLVERMSPSDNRDGLDELLEMVGLDYNDRFEFMVRWPGTVGGLNIIVRNLTEDERKDPKYNPYLNGWPGTDDIYRKN